MRAEVAIVGAGPAGIFAARAAARKAQVLVLDDNLRPGGQIWRRNPLLTALPGNVTLKTGVRVLGPWQEHSLLLETPDGPSILEYDRLILATGESRVAVRPLAGTGARREIYAVARTASVRRPAVSAVLAALRTAATTLAAHA